MKKVILALGLLSFIAFGALAVQNLGTATFGVEIADFDKDPTKDGDKKKKNDDKKEVKSDDKATATGEAKAECASKKTSCCSKKTACCSKSSKVECAKEDPDKK